MEKWRLGAAGNGSRSLSSILNVENRGRILIEESGEFYLVSAACQGKRMHCTRSGPKAVKCVDGAKRNEIHIIVMLNVKMKDLAPIEARINFASFGGVNRGTEFPTLRLRHECYDV